MNAETRFGQRLIGPGAQLQWGRVLMNAETHSLWLTSSGARVALASMGPRSHERGNPTTLLAGCDSGWLQWGRVLMNAETYGRRNHVRHSADRQRFNGAAFS